MSDDVDRISVFGWIMVSVALILGFGTYGWASETKIIDGWFMSDCEEAATSKLLNSGIVSPPGFIAQGLLTYRGPLI